MKVAGRGATLVGVLELLGYKHLRGAVYRAESGEFQDVMDRLLAT